MMYYDTIDVKPMHKKECSFINTLFSVNFYSIVYSIQPSDFLLITSPIPAETI